MNFISLNMRGFFAVTLSCLVMVSGIAGAEELKEDPINQTLLEQAEYELLAKSDQEILQYISTLSKQLNPNLTPDGALFLLGDTYGQTRSKIIQSLGPKMAENSVGLEESKKILKNLEKRNREGAVIALKGAYETPLSGEHLIFLTGDMDFREVNKIVKAFADIVEVPLEIEEVGLLLDLAPADQRDQGLKYFAFMLPEELSVSEANALAGDVQGRDRLDVFRVLKDKIPPGLGAEDLSILMAGFEDEHKENLFKLFSKHVGSLRAAEIIGLVKDIDPESRTELIYEIVSFSKEPFSGEGILALLKDVKTDNRITVVSSLKRKGLIQGISVDQFIIILGDLWAQDRLKAIREFAEYVRGSISQEDVGRILDGIPDVKDRESAIKALSK